MYEKIEENYGLFDSGVVVLEKTQNVTKYQIDCNTPDTIFFRALIWLIRLFMLIPAFNEKIHFLI